MTILDKRVPMEKTCNNSKGIPPKCLDHSGLGVVAILLFDIIRRRSYQFYTTQQHGKMRQFRRHPTCHTSVILLIEEFLQANTFPERSNESFTRKLESWKKRCISFWIPKILAWCQLLVSLQVCQEMSQLWRDDKLVWKGRKPAIFIALSNL